MSYRIEIRGVGPTSKAQGFEWDRAAAGEHVEYTRTKCAPGADVVYRYRGTREFELTNPVRLGRFAYFPVRRLLRQSLGVGEKDVSFSLLNSPRLTWVDADGHYELRRVCAAKGLPLLIGPAVGHEPRRGNKDAIDGRATGG